MTQVLKEFVDERERRQREAGVARVSLGKKQDAREIAFARRERARKCARRAAPRRLRFAPRSSRHAGRRMQEKFWNDLANVVPTASTRAWRVRFALRSPSRPATLSPASRPSFLRVLGHGAGAGTVQRRPQGAQRLGGRGVAVARGARARAKAQALARGPSLLSATSPPPQQNMELKTLLNQYLGEQVRRLPHKRTPPFARSPRLTRVHTR